VSADTIVTPESMIAEGESAVGPLDNRFHVVAVACQRVTQIRNGARPRLDPQGHKPCFLAVAEVVAGAVPYYLS
jgi:DNA-directed RNA polymerase subunit K/omega